MTIEEILADLEFQHLEEFPFATIKNDYYLRVISALRVSTLVLKRFQLETYGFLADDALKKIEEILGAEG